MKIDIEQRDFALLEICAIRYCHGRETYMPSLIQKIVLGHLEYVSDNDLDILINDCKFQQEMNLFGDEMIDKPGWISYEKKLLDEKQRRGSNEV